MLAIPAMAMVGSPAWLAVASITTDRRVCQEVASVPAPANIHTAFVGGTGSYLAAVAAESASARQYFSVMIAIAVPYD